MSVLLKLTGVPLPIDLGKMNILDENNQLIMESLNALFEYATEGILITNQQGEILRINPSALKLFGYQGDDSLKGKKIEVLIPKRFAQSHVEKREKYYENPKPRAMGKNIELYALKKDGTEFPVEISLSYYKKEEETFVIAFIIDITERKKYHDSILKLTHSLEQKVEERTKILQEALTNLEASKQQLSESLEKEKELNEMKSRFVTMASHEFRTPLSTILSSTSLIGKYMTTDDDEKRQKHVNRIKSAVANLNLILNDFLSAERLEEGKALVHLSTFSYNDLVYEVMNEMHNLLKENQSINYVHTGTELIYCDKQKIKNILINLISNAIKFTAEGKEIIVRSSANEHTITLSVSDQGIGIPQDEQKYLFDRFFRAKNVTNIQGTGLGLNIVKKYVEALNGDIEFKSELNKGTEFKILIPTKQKA